MYEICKNVAFNSLLQGNNLRFSFLIPFQKGKYSSDVLNVILLIWCGISTLPQ